MGLVEGKVAFVSGVARGQGRSHAGLLDVSDVANQVLHLVSDAGQLITGTTLVCDAGFTAR